MRKILLFVCFSVFGLFCVGSAFAQFAQFVPSLFQPLTWEQASLIAARENKLVLVSVGTMDTNIEKLVQKQPELTNYMLRNVVAIQIDISTPFGKEFESRLLMYPSPTLAFFMPYGDLLGLIAPEEVERKPDVLRETLLRVQKMAEKKKRNSRSISFLDISLEEVLALASEDSKNIFLYISTDNNQASLLMEKNIFNLDKVADFYNSSFISLHLKQKETEGILQKYQIKELPAFLYLNDKGKLLYSAEGFYSEEDIIVNGNKALQKAKGIPFENLTDNLAQEKARQLGKLIFIDYYVDGREHQNLVNTVYTDPDVANSFAKYFVNISREGEQSALVFTTANGEELHRVVKVDNEKDLLDEAQRVVEGRGLKAMAEAYRQSKREAGFIEEYIFVLSKAAMTDDASQVAMDYLSPLSAESLKEKRYWDIFNLYVRDASPAFFEYLLMQRNELFALYGEDEVKRKITVVWSAGASHFVEGGSFDEDGFKAYAKRLKKEKLENWRQIVRNARMSAAEKVGDWKSFITLAEERWNEEKLSDIELYRWGVKINEQCSDEGQRYKMAQWIMTRAVEIDRQEYLSGRVKIDSYKGFFRKLVSDLLKE